MAASLVLVLAWFSWSIGTALTAPGTDSTAARVAEWGRYHHLGWAVTGLERAQYALNPPKTGGSVPGGVPTITPQSPPTHSTRTPSRHGHAHHGGAAPRHTDPPSHRAGAGHAVVPPAPLPSTAGPRLAHEGQWQTLMAVGGKPAMQVAFVRPDSRHTSYLADVVWMNPQLLRFELFPGIRYAGQPHTGPSHLSGAALNQVLATFNSGFQLKDSHGGYWQDGKTTQSLVTGAASMVFGTNGSLRIEPWPGGRPGRGVDAVRQNLTMLINHGLISPLVRHPHKGSWGATVGNSAYVWRSGIGTRADGSIVFVLGPALDVATLAATLHAAGAVQAMELDINPDWTDFFTYTHPGPGQAVPSRLGSDKQPALDRYLHPCTRDFVAVYPAATPASPLPE